MKKSIAMLLALPIVLSSASALAAPSDNGLAHGKGLGLKQTPQAVSVPKFTATNASVAVASLDLSANVPAIGDQGQQGSCVAWATAYYSKSYGKGQFSAYGLSNEYSPSFVYNQLNGGVDGGLYPSDAYKLLVDKGDTTLDKMGYKDTDYLTQPNATQLADAALHKNLGYYNFFLGAGKGTATVRQAVKDALVGTNGEHKLVGIAIPVYPEFDNATATDTYVITSPTKRERSRGGHMITIVGFDDNKAYSGGVGAFKIVNQWGTSWGNKGYSWISYDFFQNQVSEAWTMDTNN
jgi:C1A family cysteine protease